MAPPPVPPGYAAYVSVPPPSRAAARPASPGPPPHLAPKPSRRRYGDSTPGQLPRGPAPVMVEPASVTRAIEAMLDAHALDWAGTQRRNCRSYLLSPSGRFQQWCGATGIVVMAELTTDRVADFLAAMLDSSGGPGLKAATVAKFRGHLRSLARFQATTPGFGDGLADIDRIPPPRMAREVVAAALTPGQEERILAACTSTRDRLIVELFLATGLRVSEMAGLLLPNVLLEARPPRLLARTLHQRNTLATRRHTTTA